MRGYIHLTNEAGYQICIQRQANHTLSHVVFVDRDFNFIRVNDAYARACKRNVSDFPGHNHFAFYPSDAQEIFEEVVRTKYPFQTTARPLVFPDDPARKVI